MVSAEWALESDVLGSGQDLHRGAGQMLPFRLPSSGSCVVR